MMESKLTGEIIEPPKYFITLNYNGFIVEIDLTKLNVIQRFILRLLGIKISKYDEEKVKKITEKS